MRLSNSPAPIIGLRWRHVASSLARLTICILTMVAITAALHAVPLRDRALSASLVFLFVVLIVAAVWGFRYAIFVSLLAALGFSWLLPPVGVFWIDDPREVLRMIAFLVIGIIASGFLESARNEALKAKQREEALRRSEAYLAEAQRLTHTGSWAWSPVTDRVLYWSEEMFRIFGLDPKKGIPARETFRQRVHPEDRDKVYEHIQKSVSQKVDYVVEHRIVLPNGTVRHIETIGHPELNSAGEVIEYIGTAVDVTERKHVERELREAETRFRTYVDHATDAFFVHARGERARIIDVNRQGCDSLGYAREELIGMSPLDLDPGADEPFFKRIGTRIDAGETVTFETSLRRKDGTLFPVEIRLRPFSYQGRRVVLSLARDITERKRAEEERERLRQLEAELARMNRVGMMGELAASLAHEIKQPIAGAVMSARACLQWLQREPPEVERARQSVSRIVNDVKRATDIVDRNYSLYTRATTEREPVNVNEIIQQIVALLQDAASRHSVAIRTELDPALPTTTADRVQLQQVLMNLMLNGIEAMKGEGGELNVTSKRTEDGQLLILVSDSGIGLPIEESERLFEAFFTTKPQGTGMGLAISRRIIEAHGGRLWASPNARQGATFQFTLASTTTSSHSAA